MNKKQLKDLHTVLRSLELNEIVLSNIQQTLGKEIFVLEQRRDNYENKGSDYWDDKATEVDDRIDTLNDETDGLEEIASSLQELIELLQEKLGEIEGNTIQAPYRTSVVIKTEREAPTTRDALFDDCARFIAQMSWCSIALLQRRFGIGYNRAGLIMDQLEAASIVGPDNGPRPRQVLVDAIAVEDRLQSL